MGGGASKLKKANLSKTNRAVFDFSEDHQNGRRFRKIQGKHTRSLFFLDHFPAIWSSARSFTSFTRTPPAVPSSVAVDRFFFFFFFGSSTFSFPVPVLLFVFIHSPRIFSPPILTDGFRPVVVPHRPRYQKRPNPLRRGTGGDRKTPAEERRRRPSDGPAGRYVGNVRRNKHCSTTRAV